MTKEEKVLLAISGTALVGLVSFGVFSIINSTPLEFKGGKETTESRDVSGFSKIDINLKAKVYITQSEVQKIEVKTGKNILEKIKTEEDGDVLEISKEDKFFLFDWNNSDIEVYIEVPNLEKIELNSSGDIIISNFDFENIKLYLPASGNVEMENVTATNFEAKITGSGDIEASGFANTTSIKITGSGNFEGRELQTNHMKVNITGSGNVETDTLESLDVEIPGSGNVYYKEYENIDVKKEIKGVGKVEIL